MDMETLPIISEIEEQAKRGILVIVTGPSGAGKDTIISHLLEDDHSIEKIITTTSRSLREKESEGNPYYFVSRDRFEELIAEGAFFEWVEFRGELYGTQKKTLSEALDKGVTVIWKIETKGVKNIKDKIKQLYPRVVFVYITADSIDSMRERVLHDEGIAGAQKRWNEPLVVWELRQYQDCDYLIVNRNDDLEQSVNQLKAIIETKRLEVIPTDTDSSTE